MKKRPLPPNIKLYSEKAERVFKGERFDVYQWQQKVFDGTTATYEIVKRADTVIILPVIGDEVVIVKEQQPHWEKPVLKMVAGMINDGEDLLLAARRELEEETGLIFKDLHLVHIDTVTPAVEWFAYTFIATGFQGEKEKHLDSGEKIENVKVSFDTLIEMAREGKLFYRARLVEDMLMQNKATELKDMLKNPTKYSIPL